MITLVIIASYFLDLTSTKLANLVLASSLALVYDPEVKSLLKAKAKSLVRKLQTFFVLAIVHIYMRLCKIDMTELEYH